MLYGGLLLLPFALFQLPDHTPGWKPVGSLLGLAVLGTAVAQLLLFRILRLYGAARLSLVTYLIPPFALLYGSLILDEPLRPSMLVGLGLILGGGGVRSGVLGAARRPVGGRGCGAGGRGAAGASGGGLGCGSDDAEGVRLRRAEPTDVDFVVELLAHDEVEPFLSLHRGRVPRDGLAR